MAVLGSLAFHVEFRVEADALGRTTIGGLRPGSISSDLLSTSNFCEDEMEGSVHAATVGSVGATSTTGKTTRLYSTQKCPKLAFEELHGVYESMSIQHRVPGITEDGRTDVRPTQLSASGS